MKIETLSKNIIQVIIFFLFQTGTLYAQKPHDFKFPDPLCDTLNKLQVGINFEPTRYKPGFEYINEDGYKVILVRYEHVYTQFGVKVYRWQARMRLKNGTEILFWTDDYWLDINNGIANNNVYYDGKKNRIVYPPKLKTRSKSTEKRIR